MENTTEICLAGGRCEAPKRLRRKSYARKEGGELPEKAESRGISKAYVRRIGEKRNDRL